MDSQKSYPLVVWVDHNQVVLNIYCTCLRKDVQRMRAYFSTRVSTVQTQFDQFVAAHYPDIVERIAELQIRLNTKSTGAADTEGSLIKGMRNSPEEIAERFLLKNAYREAARLHHPDKGGNADTFSALNEAYRTGDLGSVREFVLAHQRSVQDQISYWKTELEKPSVRWQKFKDSPQYGIVKLLMNRDLDTALKICSMYLRSVETALVANLNGFNQFPTTTPER